MFMMSATYVSFVGSSFVEIFQCCNGLHDCHKQQLGLLRESLSLFPVRLLQRHELLANF